MANETELKELKDIPKYDQLYFLEVQRFDHNNEFVHLGYMSKLFWSKKDATLFYKKYNCGDIKNGISDRNTRTNLRYKIQKYSNEKVTIEPFDGISGIWIQKHFTPLGEVVKLAEPMKNGMGRPVAEFPVCGSEECWCYDCSMEAVREDGLEKDEHRLLALRNAKRRRTEYLLS
jgi:hypothetical protein